MEQETQPAPALPAVILEWDAAKQDVILKWDQSIATWELVLAIIEIGRIKAEVNLRLAMAEQAARQHAERQQVAALGQRLLKPDSVPLNLRR